VLAWPTWAAKDEPWSPLRWKPHCVSPFVSYAPYFVNVLFYTLIGDVRLYRSELPGVPGQVRHHQHAVDLQHLLVLCEGFLGRNVRIHAAHPAL
jgi:hypothetical protein